MHFHNPLCEVENCIYGLYKGNYQHIRGTFPCFLFILPFSISIISFSQVFSTFLHGMCVAFCLIHLTVAIVNKSENFFFFRTILYYLEPFCSRGMVTNSRTIQFKGPNGWVQ